MSRARTGTATIGLLAGARRHRGRPSWATWAAAGGVSAASSLVGVTGGAGWYLSSLVLGVDRGAVDYPVRIREVHGDQIVLSRDIDTQRAIALGLTWPQGHAVLGPEVTRRGRTVIRRVDRVVRGTLATGRAYSTGFYHDGDPSTALGLDFATAPVIGPLGPMPAWLVPAPAPTAPAPTAPASAAPASAAPASAAPASAAPASTWVVAVHGRGARPAETLRALPTLHAAGLPVLSITYRNDENAPPSPDGFYHLGDTEWLDLAAAVRYAREHGATGVILYGWSMGGAIALTALRRMAPAEADLVRALILDSPVIDWRTTLRFQAAQRHLPDPLVRLALRLIEYRCGLRLDSLDQRPYAPHLAVPTLMFVDLDDVTVAPGPAVEFAQARPDLVRLVRTSGGGHTRSWNVDPDGYARHLAGFLATLDANPAHPIPRFAT